MKKKWLGILTLSLAAVLSFGVFVGCGPTEKSKTISVVAKGRSHAFWMAVKSGADKAGAEKGYAISFQGPDNESPASIPQQREQLQGELNANPMAIVLATIGLGMSDQLKAAAKSDTPIITFDSGLFKDANGATDLDSLTDSEKKIIKGHVATSNYKAAELAAENFYKSVKPDIQAAADGGYALVIIQHDRTQTGIDRASGFQEKFWALATADGLTGKLKLKDNKIEILVADGDASNAYSELLTGRINAGKVDAVFMCNEGVVNQIFNKVDGKDYQGIKFCGFDAGDSQIKWIRNANNAYDNAPLIGSVAQDSIDMGYQAVIQAINAAEGKTVTTPVEISGAWYNIDNIDEMIAKKLVYGS